MSVAELTIFFGWLSVINFGVLLFSTLMIVTFKSSVSNLHAKMFSLTQEDVSKLYFQYLGNFKIMTIIFCLAPYIALKVM